MRSNEHLKILTIDDEEAIRQSIAMFLEDYDYTVVEACDGEEGLEVFDREKPDLVLVDLRMPKMDGLEVMAKLKEISPGTPIIVASGTGFVGDVVEALRKGAWNFLMKPFEDMTVMRHAVERALERAQLIEENKERAEDLARTNEALRESLDQLKKAQSRLVESEKMASLGGLVAGVAHEINTPVGIGVTAASHLREQAVSFKKKYGKGEASHDDLGHYLDVVNEGSLMILSNLKHAAELIQGFKQVAVDRSTETLRNFDVCKYIEEILIGLKPKLKMTNHICKTNCEEDIKITSFPGALSQIIINFVVNSLSHGFEGIEAGEMEISLSRLGNEGPESNLEFVYKDNGIGMTRETLDHIFEPFYTTKRGQGGTGLGMHVVYNLVTQTLDGEIRCESSPGAGTKFTIIIPDKSEDLR